jgi:hypothetical protein
MSIHNKKAIYLAILNEGTMRVELSNVINKAILAGEYELYITHPSFHPITQNRNKIVQDFLSKPQYDYLFMIDDDNVPPADFLHLADYDEDIVGSLYVGYNKGMIIPFCLDRAKTGLFEVADLKKKRGFAKCDAVGTGVICIRRNVLEDERLKFPFRNEYDKDGIKKLGLDINFCKRAGELGYKVFCDLDMVSAHWKEMDLNELYKVILERDGYKEAYEKLLKQGKK